MAHFRSTSVANKCALLEQAALEALQIVGRHDGIHLLHNDCQAVVLLKQLALQGHDVDLVLVESVLRKMREVDVRGVYSRGLQWQ